jgi:hypothetical protein
MDQPGAVKALQEAAAAAGLTDKDLEEAFETAYGTPVADASLGNLAKMMATLRGAA